MRTRAGSNLATTFRAMTRSVLLPARFSHRLGWLLGLLLVVPLVVNVNAAPLQDQQIISVTINKSRILDWREPIARVSIANPAIADILPIKPDQIYINGKAIGSTNMILWDEQGQVVRQIGLEVTQDIEALKEKLYRLLPGERIKVRPPDLVPRRYANRRVVRPA